MRVLVALALAYVGGPWTASGQTDLNTESNASCVERLRMPVYPGLANAARISGSVTAIVTLAADGSVRATRMELGAASPTARRLFSKTVERALRASIFRKSCGGKSVRLVFNFVLKRRP